MNRRNHPSGNKEFNPETLALGYGYDPFLSEGAVKPPVFLTSTFQFRSAEEGKEFFALVYGLKEKEPGQIPGLIYSRLNNPNLQIFEERIAAWDKTEMGAVFSSGMAAISTTIWTLLRPGDQIISTVPVYGGTHYLFSHILPLWDVEVRYVLAGDDAVSEMARVAREMPRLKMIYLETPANPSNIMVDIQETARLAQKLSKDLGHRVITAVDNTFLGPVFQRPAPLGADLVIYSATKFIGGHSDLIAGVVTGPKELLEEIIKMRTILGTMATPFSGWLLLRSLETLSIRMRRQAKNARELARILHEHPRVKKVNYPGLLKEGTTQYQIYKKQCSGPGSLISFDIDGGEEEAFAVLNRFVVFRLAVSLGGTESLVEHPMTMTHSDVPPEELKNYGVNESTIRMSVGIEHLSDLRRDLLYALEALEK